jgi:glycosyltransferase involved in cell wall biosynthesis
MQAPALPRLVTALTQGSRVPSTRFRVMQHVVHLRARGLLVRDLPARFGAYPPPGLARRAAWFPAAVADAVRRTLATRSSSVCLLQRELVSTLHTAERLIRCPLVFDVDDAIYLHRRGAQSDAIARQARLVICGNRVLAEHYAGLAPIAVLPTAVDTTRFVPADADTGASPVIGWSGTSSGFAYLESIQPALARVLARHEQARLVVMAERSPALPLLPQQRVQFIPWGEDVEVSVLQTFTVGLMPLVDDAWSRGKCSFKMLTYMACGVPVVVSPVGMNADVLTMDDLGYGPRSEDEWVDAIDAILADASLGHRMGKRGRSVAEAHFSCDVIAPRLAELLIQAAT